jgi:hypothetical protein
MQVFGQFEELAAPEIFAEMGYPYIGLFGTIFFEVRIFESPVVGEVGTYQYHIAGFERPDAVAHKLGALAFFEMDEFYFGMVMPPVVNVRNAVPPDAKGMPGVFGYL